MLRILFVYSENVSVNCPSSKRLHFETVNMNTFMKIADEYGTCLLNLSVPVQSCFYQRLKFFGRQKNGENIISR